MGGSPFLLFHGSPFLLYKDNKQSLTGYHLPTSHEFFCPLPTPKKVTTTKNYPTF